MKRTSALPFLLAPLVLTDCGAGTAAWSCFEELDGSGCFCEESARAGDVVNASACAPYPCCFSKDESSCECTESVSCDAEVASRPGVAAVDQCPPSTAVAGACASEGENCRPTYLRSQGLEGCCPGAFCDLGAGVVPVCRSGSEEELARARECSAAANAGPLDRRGVELVGPLVTSSGNIDFDTVPFFFVNSGPNGCITSIEATIDRADTDLGCSLRITAGPNVDPDGNFIIRELTFSARDCATAPDGLKDSYFADGPEQIDGVATFQGLACDGGLGIESYCVAGRFEFRVNGTIPGRSSPFGPTFDDLTFVEPIVLEGADCIGVVASTCPGG